MSSTQPIIGVAYPDGAYEVNLDLTEASGVSLAFTHSDEPFHPEVRSMADAVELTQCVGRTLLRAVLKSALQPDEAKEIGEALGVLARRRASDQQDTVLSIDPRMLGPLGGLVSNIGRHNTRADRSLEMTPGERAGAAVRLGIALINFGASIEDFLQSPHVCVLESSSSAIALLSADDARPDKEMSFENEPLSRLTLIAGLDPPGERAADYKTGQYSPTINVRLDRIDGLRDVVEVQFKINTNATTAHTVPQDEEHIESFHISAYLRTEKPIEAEDIDGLPLGPQSETVNTDAATVLESLNDTLHMAYCSVCVAEKSDTVLEDEFVEN